MSSHKLPTTFTFKHSDHDLERKLLALEFLLIRSRIVQSLVGGVGGGGGGGCKLQGRKEMS